MRFFYPAKKVERPKGRLDGVKPPLLKGVWALEKQERELKKKKVNYLKKKAKDMVPGDCKYSLAWGSLIIPKTYRHSDGSRTTFWLAPHRKIKVMDYDRSWVTIDCSDSLF